MPTMPEDVSETALAAERAAGAAEAAAEAAGRAAGAMEQMGDWMARLASQSGPLALAGAEAAGMQEKIGKGGPGAIKRGVMAIGQRVSELSEGRYGLGVESGREEKKLGKRAERRRVQRERQLARKAQVTWFPWMLGLSLGLVIGMIGVAYWQRRRLQQFWGQTSQQAQHVTEGIRQRFEASRGAAPQATPLEASMGTATKTPDYMSLGSSRADTDVDRQVNGRIESTKQ